MDALQVAARAAAGRIERLRRAGGQQHRVVFGQQLVRVDELHRAAALLHDLRHVAAGEIFLPADVGAGDELDALGRQQIDAPLHDALVELHVRNAVHQQAADAVGPLVDGDVMADLVELRGGGQPGRAAADDRHALAGPLRRRLRRDPAFGEAAVDDRVLDVLDRHRRIGDAQHARAFARGRAGAAGELGKVVRLVQPIERVLPAALVDQVVPLGNEIVDRAARFALAKRHAAIHAARTLRAQVQLGRRGEDFQEILRPLQRIAIRHRLPLEFFKACGFAHELPAMIHATRPNLDHLRLRPIATRCRFRRDIHRASTIRCRRSTPSPRNPSSANLQRALWSTHCSRCRRNT